MKRHISLHGLSHDHHQALILAQLIKKNAPAYKTLPKDTDGKIVYSLKVWNEELKIHFKNEEEILFPFIRGKNEELDTLIDKIIAEHIEIEKLFKQLPTAENKIELLNKIGILLDEHVRLEERVLFTKIQENFSEKELMKLEGKIPRVKP